MPITEQRSGGGDALQLGEHRAQVVGTVLGVDEQPVVAAPGDQFGACNRRPALTTGRFAVRRRPVSA